MKAIVLCLSLLSVALLAAAAEIQPIDFCNKPKVCSSDIKIPDPVECDKYYLCDAGSWTRMNCSNGTSFDNVTRKCLNANVANCQLECPSVTGLTGERFMEMFAVLMAMMMANQQPETCEDVGQCVDNKKYAERSSCRNFYLCTGGRLDLQSCPFGKVFDIKVAECIDAPTGFDCFRQCTNLSSHSTSGSTTERATAAAVIGLSLLVLCLRRP